MKIVSELEKQQPMNSGEPKSHTDAELWESLKEGDADVFEAIFKKYYGFLYNYCLRFQDDEEEIKDCIQILFITIWERREYLGATTSIRSYLLASLRRLILKRIKAQSGRVELDAETFTLHTELSTEAKMILDQSDIDTVALLQSCMNRLPERQKEALFLKYYSNQSFAEIASVMNITTRAVYKLIYKALDSLSEEITRLRRF